MTEREGRARRWAAASAAAILIAPSAVWADVAVQDTNPLTFVVVLGLLALLPFLLMMVTSFVKIAVVLSLLRTAIGAQQVPPSQVITGLAIILSIYVMAPVITETYEIIEPAAASLEASGAEVTPSFAIDLAPRAAAPLKEFLLRHADPSERLLLHELAVELRAPEERSGLSPDDFLVAIPGVRAHRAQGGVHDRVLVVRAVPDRRPGGGEHPAQSRDAHAQPDDDQPPL